MEEDNIGLIYGAAGGDTEWGNIDDFRRLMNNPEDRKLIYESVGGDSEWGNFDDFTRVAGIGDSAPVQQAPVVDPAIERENERMRRASLGLSSFDQIESMVEKVAEVKMQEAGGPEKTTWEQIKGAFSAESVKNSWKLGVIQGQLGNMDEVIEDNLLGAQENRDPEYFTKKAALQREKRLISEELEKNRTEDRNLGRFISEAVSGFISSPVSVGAELLADADGVIETIGAVLLAGPTQGKSVQLVLAHGGADVEAGAIMGEKIDEYAAANGIDLEAEDGSGFAKVYEDKEFIRKTKNKAAIGAAIVGATDALGGIAVSKMGSRSLRQIGGLKDVGYNFMGRVGVGMAFDGTGEVIKQLAVNGDVDAWEAGLEMFTPGPGRPLGNTIATIRDVKAIGQNKTTNELIRSGEIRPRDDQNTSNMASSIANDVEMTPQEVAEAEQTAQQEASITPEQIAQDSQKSDQQIKTAGVVYDSFEKGFNRDDFELLIAQLESAVAKGRDLDPILSQSFLWGSLDTSSYSSFSNFVKDNPQAAIKSILQALEDNSETTTNTSSITQQDSSETSTTTQQTQEGDAVLETTTNGTLNESILEELGQEEVVDAIQTAGNMKRARANTLREQAIETGLDDNGRSVDVIANEMVKRGVIKEGQKNIITESTGVVREAIAKIPVELRTSTDPKDQARAREIVQGIIDIDTQESIIATQQAKIEKLAPAVAGKAKRQLEKEQRKLEKINTVLSNTLSDAGISLETYDQKTQILRTAQNLNKQNYRLPRAALKITGNQVKVDPEFEDYTSSIIDAVEQYNLKNPDAQLDFAPDTVFAGSGQQFVYSTSPQLNFRDVDIDQTTPGNVANLTFNSPTASGLKDAVVGLQENGILATTRDAGNLTDAQTAAWNSLVDEGLATFDVETGYTALSTEAAKQNQADRVRRAGETMRANREVKQKRQQRLSDAQQAAQVKRIMRGIKFAGKSPKLIFKKQDAFEREAPAGLETNRAYVTDLDSDSPTIVINSGKATTTTIPHEIAHVLIADKLGTPEQRKDLVVKMVQNLRAVLENSEDATERAVLLQLDELTKRYEALGDSPDVVAEEFLAELSAFMAENKTRIEASPSLSTTIIAAIKRAIFDILGLDVQVDINTINDAISFVNNLADELSGDNSLGRSQELQKRRFQIERRREALKQEAAEKKLERVKAREALLEQRRREKEKKQEAAAKKKQGEEREAYLAERLADRRANERIDEFLSETSIAETIDSGNYTDVGVYGIDGFPENSFTPGRVPAAYQMVFPGGKNGRVYILMDKAAKKAYLELKRASGDLWNETPHPLKDLVDNERGEGGIILDIRGQDIEGNQQQYDGIEYEDAIPDLEILESTTYDEPSIEEPAPYLGLPPETVEALDAEDDVEYTTDTAPQTARRIPQVGETFVYNGSEYVTTKADGNKFSGRGDRGDLIKDVTLDDAEFEGTKTNDTRSQIDEDVDPAEEAFIEQVRNANYLSTAEKNEMLKEFGIEGLEVLERTIRNVSPNQKLRESIPLSDDAFDAQLTEEEVKDGVYTFYGVKVDNDTIGKYFEKMGLPPLSTKGESQSFAVQFKMAARMGLIDPPGQIGTNTNKILARMAQSGSISNLEMMGLMATYGEIQTQLAQTTNQIAEARNMSAARKAVYDPMPLENKLSDLQFKLQAYGEALRMAKTVYGRGLQLASKFVDLRIDLKAEYADFIKNVGIYLDNNTRAILKKAYDTAEAAQNKLESERATESGKILKERVKEAGDSIKEIMGLGLPKDPATYLDEIAFVLSKKKPSRKKPVRVIDKGTRSAIGDPTDPTPERIITPAIKYSEIYKAVRYLIANEGLNNLDDITKQIIKINNSLTDPEFDIDADDVRVALELGLEKNVKARKNALRSKIAKMKRFRDDSEKLISLNDVLTTQGVRSEPKIFTQFADQLRGYVNTILEDGFDTINPDQNSVSAALNVLQNVINEYDSILHDPNGQMTMEDMRQASKRFSQALSVLGINKKSGVVDIDGLLRGVNISLAKEDQGVFSSSELKINGITEKSPDVYRAEHEFVLALSEIKKVKERADYKRRKAQADSSLEKIKIFLEGTGSYAFELGRQILFSVDYSFIGVQAGLNVIGMIPQVAIDTGVLLAKGGDYKAPFVSAYGMWARNLANMFAFSASRNYINKANVREGWLQFMSDPIANEMMALRADVFGNPTKEAQDFQREELARADFGGRLQDWADRNKRSPISKSVRFVGAAGNYFSDTYTMFMNDIRLHQYKMFLALNPYATDAQKTAVIEGIMDFTGRGVAENSAERFFVGDGAAKILAAPRLYLSRYKVIKNFFSSLIGLGITSGGKLLNAKQVSTLKEGGNVALDGLDFASIELLKQYAAVGMGMMGVYMLMDAWEWEWEEDPKDKSFLKFKKDDKVIDISAGMSQYIKIPAFAFYLGTAARSQQTADDIFGEAKLSQQASLNQRELMGDIGAFLKYKLHPTWGMLRTAIESKNAIGEGMGITAENRWANVLKLGMPISAQGGVELLGLGRDRLDPADPIGVESIPGGVAGLLGLSEIDYENSLKDIRVLEYTDGPVQYSTSTAVTGSHAKKFIIGNPGERSFDEIDDSVRKEALQNAFKQDAQNALGEWILSELDAGRQPAKNQINAKRDQIVREKGKQYYDAYVRTQEWNWRRAPEE